MSQLECGAQRAGGNWDEMTGTRRSCDIYMELMQWTALTGEGVQILDGVGVKISLPGAVFVT